MTDREIEGYLWLADWLAQQSRCMKARYGAVLVRACAESCAEPCAERSRSNGRSDSRSDRRVLGMGYNFSVAPGQCCIRSNVVSGTRAECCYAIHAEQAALMLALSRHGLDGISGSTMYVVGRRPDGSLVPITNFYCTLCARMMLSLGVDEVVLATDCFTSRDGHSYLYRCLSIEQVAHKALSFKEEQCSRSTR